MLLTLAPQTMWACPMTGRIDVAERVCVGAMAAPAGAMPCAHMGGKCCKPISVPPSPDDNAQHTAYLDAVASHTFATPVVVTPILDIAAVLPSIVQIQPAPVCHYLARFNNSPPRLWTHYSSLSLSGRAPPVL